MPERRLLACLVALALLGPASAAQAATVVGADSTVIGVIRTCAVACARLPIEGGPYPPAAPVAGVVTSWRVNAQGSVRLQIARAAGGTSFVAVRQGPPRTAANIDALSTFGERVPIGAGDIAGLALAPQTAFRVSLSTGVGTNGAFPQASDGETFMPAGSLSGPMLGLLSFDATVEPDADADGYGDETQDGCPALAARQSPPCVAAAPSVPANAGTAPADTTAPSVRGIRVSAARITFTLSEGGTLRVQITRLLDGRRVKRRCVAVTKRNRGAQRCTRRGRASTQTISAASGAGRATLKTRLRSGRYELKVTATDGAGNASAPDVRTVTVKR